MADQDQQNTPQPADDQTVTDWDPQATARAVEAMAASLESGGRDR